MVRPTLRRYKKLALLWAILATGFAPATVRAAYAEVGPVASAQLAECPSDGEARLAAAPNSPGALAPPPRPGDSRLVAAPSPARVRPTRRLYLLHRALLR